MSLPCSYSFWAQPTLLPPAPTHLASAQVHSSHVLRGLVGLQHCQSLFDLWGTWGGRAVQQPQQGPETASPPLPPQHCCRAVI